MKSMDSTVYIVEGNLSMRQFLEEMLSRHQLRVVAFSSAENFLNQKNFSLHQFCSEPCCLLSRFYLADMSGLELLRLISNTDHYITTIFYADTVSLETSVQAIREGATDFLITPFSAQTLLKTLQRALYQNTVIKSWQNNIQQIKQSFARLTPREKQVFELVVAGYLNKQIAWELGICEKTVKVHRAQVMRKMNVRSLADLVRLSENMKYNPYLSVAKNAYPLNSFNN